MQLRKGFLSDVNGRGLGRCPIRAQSQVQNGVIGPKAARYLYSAVTLTHKHQPLVTLLSVLGPPGPVRRVSREGESKGGSQRSHLLAQPRLLLAWLPRLALDAALHHACPS